MASFLMVRVSMVGSSPGGLRGSPRGLEPVGHGGSPATPGKASIEDCLGVSDGVGHDGLAIEPTRHRPEPGLDAAGGP